MKRAIVASLTAMMLMAFGVGVSAQDPDGPTYDGGLTRKLEEQSRRREEQVRKRDEEARKSTADQLRFERARMRARQRMQQEAWNERTGSTLRPYTNTPYWSLGLGER